MRNSSGFSPLFIDGGDPAGAGRRRVGGEPSEKAGAGANERAASRAARAVPNRDDRRPQAAVFFLRVRFFFGASSAASSLTFAFALALALALAGVLSAALARRVVFFLPSVGSSAATGTGPSTSCIS